MNYAGVAQHLERRAPKPEVAGENPAPRSTSSPWALSEAQANARKLAIAADLVAAYQSFFVPGMSDEAIHLRLAARGYGGTELRRILSSWGLADG